MNCLTEALGLALPGNGSTLATHAAPQGAVRGGRRADRRARPALLRRRRRVGAAARDRHAATRSRTRWRSTSRWAARPTPSCTCWPPPTRPSVDFTMADIDAISRRVPCLCKVAPNAAVPHGGRAPRRRHPRHPRRAATAAALLHRGRPHRARADAASVARRLGHPRRRRPRAEAVELFHAAPGGVPHRRARSRSTNAGPRWTPTRAEGCIRDVEHAYSTDGGLAVLYGNIAADGCVVKTAGVDESIWTFSGPAARVRVAGGGGRRHPRRPGRRRATWSSSATRAPRAGPACRRCSTRRRSSRAGGWARRAR